MTTSLFDDLTVTEAATLKCVLDDACHQICVASAAVHQWRDALYFECSDLRTDVRQVFIRKFFEVPGRG